MTTLTKQAGSFSEAAIDEEIVVMHLGSGEFFSLAGTAAATWRLIDGTRDRKALIDALASQFGEDALEIAEDVDDFLLELRGLGLVHDD